MQGMPYSKEYNSTLNLFQLIDAETKRVVILQTVFSYAFSLNKIQIRKDHMPVVLPITAWAMGKQLNAPIFYCKPDIV